MGKSGWKRAKFPARLLRRLRCQFSGAPANVLLISNDFPGVLRTAGSLNGSRARRCSFAKSPVFTLSFVRDYAAGRQRRYDSARHLGL